MQRLRGVRSVGGRCPGARSEAPSPRLPVAVPDTRAEPQHAGWGLGGGAPGGPGGQQQPSGGHAWAEWRRRGRASWWEKQSLAGMEVQHKPDAKFKNVARSTQGCQGPCSHQRSLRYPSRVPAVPRAPPPSGTVPLQEGPSSLRCFGTSPQHNNEGMGFFQNVPIVNIAFYRKSGK